MYYIYYPHELLTDRFRKHIPPISGVLSYSGLVRLVLRRSHLQTTWVRIPVRPESFGSSDMLMDTRLSRDASQF